MEYQKIANLIDDASNQPSKFRTRGAYNVNSQIKFKITMLKSSLCDYSDLYILVKGTISVKVLLVLLVLTIKVLLQIILIKK